MMRSVLSLLSFIFMAISEATFFGFGPTTPAGDVRQEFNVYWNVPTFMCHKYGLYFEEVSKEYGIRQNFKDQFRGDQIAILYDPGKFPALLKDTDGSVVRRNGGVPQEGNLTEHLEIFREHLISQIPEQTFNGVGVIDFESWRPIFRQNWASLSPYKELSLKLVREKHPTWDNKRVQQEAVHNFEKYGKLFMDETLKSAKSYRPFASWGYYAYPYCFNLTPNQPKSSCDPTTRMENDKMAWLFEEEQNLLPSVYMRLSLSENERVGLVEGRVSEAMRIARKMTPRQKVLPYYWYKYQDQSDTYLTNSDLESTLQKIVNLGADGFILWGSSHDVNTQEKCIGLQKYLNDVLGPTIKRIKEEASNKVRQQVVDPANNQVDVSVGQV